MKDNFISISDLSADEIHETLELAVEIKAKLKAGEEYKPLAGKTMAMIFAKPSARTRISFETGMNKLGGYALYLSPDDISIGKREAVKDIAQVISRYNEAIMARLFSHEHMLELAEYASIPVINGLTDYNHPCQVMGDILTVREHRGNLDNLKVVFVGDGNNVANSWLNLAAKIPMHFVLTGPEGYDPDEKTLTEAKESGISIIEIIHDPVEALKDADVVYTDVWASMGQEEESVKRVEEFKGYQLNSDLMSHSKPTTLVMHCLPAHRGEEITDEVIDGANSIVFDQAENRMHIQNAIMVQLMS
ncbi:MAG: ornithine carbamoyltransferase [Candidatus Marinimicrobia bacterium]|nr:ornithine carbamoyltransferase [Candidatus Neomarinimicrobiota bacterium]